MSPILPMLLRCRLLVLLSSLCSGLIGFGSSRYHGEKQMLDWFENNELESVLANMGMTSMQSKSRTTEQHTYLVTIESCSKGILTKIS